MTIAEEIAQIYPERTTGFTEKARSGISKPEKLVKTAQACARVMEGGRNREDGTIFLSKFNPIFVPPDLPFDGMQDRIHFPEEGELHAFFNSYNERDIPNRLLPRGPDRGLTLSHFITPDGQEHSVVIHVDKDDPNQDLTVQQLLQSYAKHLLLGAPAPHAGGPQMLNYKNRSPQGIPELQIHFSRWLADQGIVYDEKQNRGDSTPCFVCANSINSTLLRDLFSGGGTHEGLFYKQRGIAVFPPVYGLIPSMAKKAKLDIHYYSADKTNHYQSTAADIKAALKNGKSPDNLRAIFLVNPNNPTGSCFSEKEINEIAGVIDTFNQERAKRGVPPVLVIVDETFRNLMWDREEKTKFYPLAKNEKLRPYTISLNTFSKDLAPGHGFAYAYGPPTLIKEMTPFDGPDYDAQCRAAAVFDKKNATHLEKHRNQSVAHYKKIYKLLERSLADINQKLKTKFGGERDYISIEGKPDAGFHAVLNFSALKGTKLQEKNSTIPLETSAHLAVALMEKAKVVTYPGEMFYLDGNDMALRVSLNLEEGRFTEALKRIKDFCLELEPPEKGWVQTTAKPRNPSRGAA